MKESKILCSIKEDSHTPYETQTEDNPIIWIISYFFLCRRGSETTKKGDHSRPIPIIYMFQILQADSLTRS